MEITTYDESGMTCGGCARRYPPQWDRSEVPSKWTSDADTGVVTRRRGMRFIDVSHAIVDGMTTYPGLPAPSIGDHLTREASRSTYAEGTEFHIARIELVGNTGTYVDTPAHRYADGWDLADLPLDRVAQVPLVVIDGAGAIGAEEIEAADVRGRAVLFRTGWDRHWGTQHYLSGRHPHLTAAAAEALTTSGARLVGIDSMNVDDTSGRERVVHTMLLGAGIPIVEHLRGLGAIPDAEDATFTAVPLKVVGAGTFPVRAFVAVPCPSTMATPSSTFAA